MRQENLSAIDTFLGTLEGARTTRHASEELHACPALPEAAAAERNIRATLHKVYDGHVVVGEPPAGERLAASDLPQIKQDYWEQAQHVTPAHGAKAGFSLEDYFHVSHDRHYDAIKEGVIEEYPADSVSVRMFACIDAYATELDLDAPSSSRVLTTLFDACLPAIKDTAAAYRKAGFDATAAADKAIVDFTSSTVPAHIADLKLRASEGLAIKSSINKASLYPKAAEGISDELYASALARLKDLPRHTVCRNVPTRRTSLSLATLWPKSPQCNGRCSSFRRHWLYIHAAISLSILTGRSTVSNPSARYSYLCRPKMAHQSSCLILSLLRSSPTTSFPPSHECLSRRASS